MNEAQKWLRLDMKGGWQIIVPEIDIEPHGFPEKTEDTELAGLNCPCKPEVTVGGKMIIHNSFLDIKRIDEAMKSYD